jgi:hypothetical protein
MIIVYSFFPGDQDLALKNVQWWISLGGCKGHSVLVAFDPRCAPDTVEAIRQQLIQCFDHVFNANCKAEIDGWPQGANYFFSLASSWLAQKREWTYFLWMEPDAVPVAEKWLDTMQAEYERVKTSKPFMGDRVAVENIPLHMSGVAIYPNPLHAYAGETTRAFDTPFDMAGRDQIVTRAHWTKLILHNWKHEKLKNMGELDNLLSHRPEMVLFHSDKSGSMIDLLQIKINFSGGVESMRDQTGERNPNWKGGITGTPAYYRANKAAYRARHRERHLAHKAVQTAVARGKLVRGVCEVCGKPEAHAHHEDYARPLDVRWFCKAHHEEAHSGSSAPPAEVSCDIFIRTYPGDYLWLKWCVKSIGRFCDGFRKIVIVSPDPDACPTTPEELFTEIRKGIKTIPIQWKVLNEESEDHYLSQQIHKLYADVITDYQADYILHIDSDTVFTRPVAPSDFLDDGKVTWPYTPYSAIEVPWKPITEKFMCSDVENEFMRRFPIVIPRWLYPRLREFCHTKHGCIVSSYVKMQPLRSFSEFNALGAYAWKFHRDKFHWINTTEMALPEPFARQFFSWGGITPEVQKELDQIFPVSITESSARQCNGVVIASSEDGGNNVASDGEITLHDAIEVLKRHASINRMKVMQNLRHADLTPHYPRQRKHRKVKA